MRKPGDKKITERLGSLERQAWTMLKSGVQKQGKWYCGQYPTGWYLWNAAGEQKGPFTSFELAIKGVNQK